MWWEAIGVVSLLVAGALAILAIVFGGSERKELGIFAEALFTISWLLVLLSAIIGILR